MKFFKKSAIAVFIVCLAVLCTMLCAANVSAAEVVDSGECGDHATWTFYDNGELVIDGEGEMWNWMSCHSTPWYSNLSSITKVTINKGVTALGSSAFANCVYLNAVVIPTSVVSIGTRTFEYCIGLEELTLPDSIVVIGEGAFSRCKKLRTITIPAGVTEIGGSAFGYCNRLSAIHVDKNNPNYAEQDGVLFSKDKTVLVAYPDGRAADTYSIPEGVTTIGEGAFYFCDSFTGIMIPNTVTTISLNAFYQCDGLKNIVIPGSVKSIEERAFWECSELESVILSDGVEYIGRDSFSDCKKLSSITIPDSVKTIDEYAFYCCDNLAYVNIGKGITSIGSLAFTQCYKLQKIEVDPDNTAYTGDENGVLFNKDKTTLLQYPIGKAEAAYSIPESVTVIDHFAFLYAEALEQVTLPQNLRSLGQEAFSYTSLKEIDVPGTITFFDNAFRNCPKLTKVIIRKSDPDIFAFARSASGLFSNCPALTEFVVEEGNQFFKTIDGILYSTEDCLITYPMGRTDEQFVIADGCKTTDGWTIAGAVHLKSIIIPDSVDSISSYAFTDCESLTDVTVLSRNAEFEYNILSFYNQNITLYGYAGSTTEAYAAENGYNFVALEEPEYIPGDLSGDGSVDLSDAILLFQHSMIPDLYPIDYPGSFDFTKDGSVDISDAILLFQHSMMPDLYPID